jgi:plastocyanin
VAVVAVLGVAGTACGGGGGAGAPVDLSTPAAGQVEVVAVEMAYRPADLRVSAGGTVTLRNAGSVRHDLRIEGFPASMVEASPGQSATLPLTGIPPGRYGVFCSITGHREAGMVGTITVTRG